MDSSTAPEEPTMNDKERSQKVYQWARQQLNMRVGAGQCWDFAARALREAGARSSTTQGSKRLLRELDSGLMLALSLKS
jgi:hypothetical protein